MTDNTRTRSLALPTRLLRPVGAAGLALAAGCGGSGDAPAPWQTLSGPVAPDFELRRDVRLHLGGLADALAQDLNGDGILDIVETDFYEGLVTVGMGNGDGTFTTVSNIPTPGFPTKLTTGDLDGDGLVDIGVLVDDRIGATTWVCDTCNGPSLLLLQQDAGGFFSETARLDLPDAAFDLEAAPLTGTGRDELVTTLPDAGETWVVALVAPGVLDLVETLVPASDGGKPLTAAAIDENNDGLLDIIVGEYQVPDEADRVVVYHAALPSGPAPVHVYGGIVHPYLNLPLVRNAGDVDGDGRDDLSIAQFGSTWAALMPGSVTGIETQVLIGFGTAQTDVLFTDVDGDGTKDAIASLFDQGALAVVPGTGPFQFSTDDTRWFNVGALPRGAQTPDFFGDGVPDLFCANQGDLSILYALGDGDFRAAEGTPLGELPAFMACTDMDGDGHLDVASIDMQQRQIVFLRGAGDGSFTEAGKFPLQPTVSQARGTIVMGDFDRDGRQDLATTLFETGEVQVLRNAGTMPFVESGADSRTAVGLGPVGLDVADVDGDGSLDMAVAVSGDNAVRVLIGDGDMGFSARTPIDLGVRPIAVCLEDLDADGNLDLIATAGDVEGVNAAVVIYAGDGAGDFTLRAAIPLTDLSAVISAGDLDGDGLLDLALGQSTEDVDEVFVLNNRGAFDFDVQVLTVGQNPGALEFADVNRDGSLDLLVPVGIGELRIAVGDGQGSFTEIMPLTDGALPVPYGTMATCFEDVDEDGLPDLLMISSESPYLWVGRNASLPVPAF
jgi:hypothetical protein